MSVTIADIRYVAELARLQLSEEDCALYTQRAARVLEHIAALSRLATAEVEPTAHAVAAEGRTRPDTVRPSVHAADILANAPDHEGDLLTVPKVL
ncbi:MAG: Asp-tRNA(Asn)/Glu-tRNA(Gln) amidotransferase subunit GatC [Deltaproteobacteria bacterium]|nr:Asp-tRNA(Asn)/Glu-tRNA(Gln) amidotransferase subunit GatC [Deltaproteobacteria bacterium]